MAKCELKFPTEFEFKIDSIGKNLDKICGEVCEAGADVVLPKVRNNLKAVIKPKQEESELVRSLGVSKPAVDKKGIVNVKIGFHEPRKQQYAAKGKRSYHVITNAMIANVIEHGKHGQPARPFLAKAKRQSKKACEATMKAKMEEEINKI